ncbi:IclR family transcriptional regulator [Pelosinus baikalensis]|uniref:IclR family transcriptional regulator n=1 Tax=Pelosinus baikalensis TaxID=2892015 RepID=A0ABS8HM66_9FIRM|nr:IclR family transcriptional regulator [Pelosinus baikalensis]MCC5464293.1 IclR family transcriptional regulator [Pelosinus baikalensis]
MAGKIEVQSLHRAFDILETIGNSQIPMSIKKITEETGLPKSTVYRLLNNLENRNYAFCDTNGNYRLGYQLLMMSQWAEKDFEIKNLAKASLESLNAFTKETVHLAILQGKRVLYVDTVESPYSSRLVIKMGMTNSVHCTALGKALLINHKDAEILDILEAEGMEKRTEHTVTKPLDYLKEMEVVRKLGYALDQQECEMEGRCIGAPIYDKSGKVVAAISVSGIATRFSLDFIVKEVVSKLLDSTLRISRILGYVG